MFKNIKLRYLENKAHSWLTEWTMLCFVLFLKIGINVGCHGENKFKYLTVTVLCSPRDQKQQCK